MPSFRSLKLVVLGLAVAVVGCNRESEQATQPAAVPGARASQAAAVEKLDRSRKGEPLPDLTLKDAAGATLRLADLKGKPTLINLWATWCAPCVTELPTLDALARRAGPNVQVVTVSQDSTQTEKVRGFLADRGLAKLPAWLDPDTDLAFHYQASTLPTTVYYGADGKELWRFVGGHDWNGPEATRLLAEGS